MSAAVIEDIVEQHVDEAASLWSRRDSAVTSPFYTLQSLSQLDERLEAQINGLRLAGLSGWTHSINAIKDADPATIFPAAILAFESGSSERIELVAEACAHSPRMFRAAVSALGWLDVDHFQLVIPSLLDAKGWQIRSLGIAACGIRRVNPRTYLDKAAESSNLFLKLSAFKAAGELKRFDLLPALRKSFDHEVPGFRFEATRSALLMGDHSALDSFSQFALNESRFTMPALQIALRLIDGTMATEWLKEQSRNPDTRHRMMQCAGIVGNVSYVPMLIRMMTRPELARAAGASFSMITGVDLVEAKLDEARPESFPERSGDAPDGDKFEMEEDRHLPWPDARRVERWWGCNEEKYERGRRYLAGRPITYKNCRRLLKQGNQCDRFVAALELALHQKEEKYFNVKAPAFRTIPGR